MGDRWGRCKPQAGWVRRKDRRALSNRAIATAAVGGVGGGVGGGHGTDWRRRRQQQRDADGGANDTAQVAV